MGNYLIVRETAGSYEIPCSMLQEHAGYRVINVLRKEETPIQSKRAWLLQGLHAIALLPLHLRTLIKGEKIIAIGNYLTLFLLFLNRIHLIHPATFYWWGFQIRSSSNQQKLKKILHYLWRDNVRFIIFSKYEKEMYAERMSIPESAMIPLLYGDWQNIAGMNIPLDTTGDYYFSGGYSNRNYASLIRAWEKIDKRLVIIGSKSNADLSAYLLSPDNPNIEVLLDTAPEEFNRYLSASKACIFPFKEDTGASGQTVAIRCMICDRLIISQDISSMREYVQHNETGYLLKDMENSLPDIIREIEANPTEVAEKIRKQKELFLTSYSYDVIKDNLLKLFRA